MRAVRSLLWAAVVGGYAVLPWLAPSLTYQLTIILALGLAALAVSLMLQAGLISFGHALFYAAGAYAAAYLGRLTGAHLVITLFLSSLSASLLALIAGLLIVRYRGIFFAMLNLALSMVAYTLLLKLYNVTGGSDGLVVSATGVMGYAMGPTGLADLLFYLALASAIFTAWFVRVYLRAAAGWALGAIQDREIRVEYLGISARRVLLVAYVLSGGLAGLGGAIAGIAVGHVAPDSAYWTTSAGFVVMAVLGGGGDVFGAFAGAALYEMLSVSAAQYLSSSWELLLGIIIFVIVRFAPSGLWGFYDSLWRRVAARER